MRTKIWHTDLSIYDLKLNRKYQVSLCNFKKFPHVTIAKDIMKKSLDRPISLETSATPLQGDLKSKSY